MSPVIPSAPPASAPPSAPASVVGADGFISGPPGVSAAPTSVPAAPPEPLTAGDDLEKTTVSARRRATRRARLILDDGQSRDLVGVLLLGRAPVADTRWPTAELIPVADTTKTVSKTHAVIVVDPSGAWVEDLGSTNGVYVHDGEGAETEVPAGTRIAVPIPGAVFLGDFRMTVEEK